MNLPLTIATVVPSTASVRRDPTRHRAVRVMCHLPTPSVAVISVHGEIDASNAGLVVDRVTEHARNRHGVVLDLTNLDFFGTEGFSALHRVSVSCARAGISCATVPGTAVSRLLRICDPQGSLPAAGSVDEAIATFPRTPLPHRLQSVAPPLQ